METTMDRPEIVHRLVDTYGLHGVAASVCAEFGIGGRERAVAYCVAVLVLKRDQPRLGERRYRLDMGSPEFSERLAFWAREVARHLREWSDAYDAIQEDAEQYDITTLRTIVGARYAEDEVDEIASRLMAVFASGPRLDEMDIDLLRQRPPAGNAYVFQSPLSRWIRTSRRRMGPRDTDPIDRHADTLVADGGIGLGDIDEVMEAEQRLAEEELQAKLARVSRLANTRATLGQVIQRADGWEAELARKQPERPEDASLLARLRATILHVADQLRREAAALTGMLGFLVFAMRRAPIQQQIAMLSLRVRAIDPDTIQELAARTRTLLADERHPAWRLVEATRAAVRERGLAQSRLTALEELRDTTHRRDEILGPVRERFDQLPDVVDGNDAIAVFAAGGSTHRVKVHRSKARDELARVDPLYGAVFRRYAMGRTG